MERDTKTIRSVQAALVKDGMKASEAVDYILTIGARRIQAWRKYGGKVAAAKAGRKVAFEKRGSVKWSKAPKAKARKARKSPKASKTPAAPAAVAQ